MQKNTETPKQETKPVVPTSEGTKKENNAGDNKAPIVEVEVNDRPKPGTHHGERGN